MDVAPAPSQAENNSRNQQSHLVLLRGLIRSRFHWEQFPQQLQSALPQYPILTPELAGNGERFRESTPFSIAAMMEDIRQQVNSSRSNQQPVIIVAVSMGAMIATEWARLYPKEVDQLHLINTSFRNLSMPWQRMQAAAFFSLITRLLNRSKLESAIIRWTINSNKTPELEQRWQQFAVTHPLGYRNALAQLVSASQYRGPLQSPINNAYFYRSAKDYLVDSQCSQRIADCWQKPLATHPDAGHDLSMDDPEWLIGQIRTNLTVNSNRDVNTI